MKKIFSSLLIAALGLMTFTACEDVPEPYNTPSEEPVIPSEEVTTGDGTLASPYNYAAANELASSLSSSEESGTVYIKGVIVSIKEEYSTQYGNGSFYIADTATDSKPFYVYRALYLGNKKYASDDTQIQIGDTVIVCGIITNYSGNTPETVQNKAYLYSLNGKTSGGTTPTPTPTGEEVSCAKAVELTNALADGATSTETYTVTGYITEVVSEVSRNQQTFWMADTKDGGRVFEAYWANLPEGVAEFKVGSKVKITGTLMKYVNANSGLVTPEMKNATVVVLEEGGNTPTPTPTGVEVSCAKAVELTNALADGATSEETYTVTGYITELVSEVSRNQQTFWMADTKDGGRVFEAYWANLPEGVNAFKVGSKVQITGKLMKYVNTNSGQVTPEIKNATVVILEEGEGEDPDPSGEGTTLADFSNGDFETWTNGQPTGWKSASTASNGTLKQSTDAHSGTYSVCLVGATTGNKRLAYQEMELEAGTYAVSFYTKAATSDGGSVNPGYVPMLSSGGVGSYVYGGYINDLTTTEWKKVDYEFTLSSKTTICLVVMNSKNPGKDVLIDDYTITKK